MHLARGGWISWYESVPSTTARPGRSQIALRVRLEDGSGFDVTEMGTREAPGPVGGPLAGRRRAGGRPWASTRSARTSPSTAWPALLHGSSATLKTALTTQSLIAGVGNAYSDEALHRARLSPFKKSSNLDDERR